MMDLDSTSLPPRLDPRRVTADSDPATAVPLSAANRSSFLAGKMLRGADVVHQRALGSEDAASFRLNRTVNALAGRDFTAGHGVDSTVEAPGYVAIGKERGSPRHDQRRKQQVQMPSSSSNSQDTSTTNGTIDEIFTPTPSEGAPSRANGQDSSQESQLMQLSQIAAAQTKMPNAEDGQEGSGEQNGSNSRKRMADGLVKNPVEGPNASPVFRGSHSRNTSTVSLASTTGSRIGELSAELKTRLSYAMVKVNNGWQSHTIDQVETLASLSGSSTSSNSTIHLRQRTSASPQLSTSSHRGSNNTTPATGVHHHFMPRVPDSTNPTRWDARSQGQTNTSAPLAVSKQAPSLAPAVSIQPSQHLNNPRRNSNPRHTPSLAAHSHHASPNTAPHTPGQPSPYLGSPHQRTLEDPIIFSPHQTPQQNVREQDAMEALLFMSSPGNSANLKHNFPSSSHPISSNRTSLQRTALPGSQPRKSLPTGRPSQSQPQPKRVGFEKSPGNSGAMDIDDAAASPYQRGAPRRKVNGADLRGNDRQHASVARLKQLPLSAGLSGPSRPRPRLADEDIDRMLDRVAAEDSSDSDGEIIIPVRAQRREEAPAAQ